MGQPLSRVYGFIVKRPLQRYNVEHRAAKEISRIEDPAGPALRAPMYESDKDLLEKIRQSNPSLADANLRKDGDLYNRLQDVYVTSEDPAGHEPPKPRDNPDRPFPQDRTNYSENFIPGLMRVDKNRSVPRGKVSLDDAVQFLSDHRSKPEVHTPQHIADTFRLNPETTANALKYFQVFQVFEPKKKFDKDYDALELGKDWVEGKKEEYKSVMDYKLERDQKRKELEQKEEQKRKQELLEGGRDTQS